MATNWLVLAGKISQKPQFSFSPAGIAHCQFLIEHESNQQEANHNRRAWCMLEVIASGSELQTQTASLTKDMQVRVSGFICYRKNSSGLNTLVLHAKIIEQI